MTDALTSLDMLTGLRKVAERAKREPAARFHSLAHLIDEELLAGAFARLRNNAAAGVDGITKEQYGQDLQNKLRDLHERLKTMRYRHQPIRRVHIPKEKQGQSRPIGISTTEDKVVQNALREVLGRFFYLYLVLDLYSRKIIGWEVHETDSSDHAVDLVRRTALAEKIHSQPEKPVLHGDNGATLKATTVLAMLTWLGIRASYSRPRVSDDNAFIESLFRTVKYRPEFPAKGFATVEHARQWTRNFTSWYNHDHRHSSIRYVSPAQRHAGQDRAILAARHELYTQMKAANPRRWARHTRNWTPIAAVTLNPERDSIVHAAMHEEKKRSDV